jgi:hypothetical protein
LPTSTTVVSITNATTIVVSQAAASTLTVTATIFPWGNGDQVSTFNVPDYRGRAPVGADCMGYVASGNTCAGNLTVTYFGAPAGAAGQYGGSQSKNLTIANINAFTPLLNSITPAGTVTNGTITFPSTAVNSTTNGGNGSIATNAGSGSNASMTVAMNVSQASSSFAGTPVTPTAQSLGSGTAHGVVNPDATVNYIIKVAANSTGAGGVVSFGGMFGDIVCDSTLTCAPIGTVNTVGCTPATTSQFGCVEPDGVTTLIAGGKLTAVAGVASSVGIGSTAITGGTTADILYDNGGVLGLLTPSGTGSVCMTTNCVMTTPTLGAATATTLNTNTFMAGGYTLAGSTGKTFTFNNTLTLAGTDSTTLTFQGTDTYVGRATTDTLTNKTISGASNTLNVRLGSDVTGNLPITNLNGGSGASSTTAWFGDGTWKTPAGGGNVSNVGTPTNHQIAGWTSSTQIQGIGPGTTGQALISNGASADPSYKSGSWTLLNTLTASNSSSLFDTSSLTSAYTEYEIVFEDVLAATTATTCEIQVHAGGTFRNTSYVSTSFFGGSTTGATQNTTFIPCSVNASASNAIPFHTVIRVNNPSASLLHVFTGYTTSPLTTASWVGSVGGYWASVGAIDGFQVIMSSGNITSGQVKIYGRL